MMISSWLRTSSLIGFLFCCTSSASEPLQVSVGLAPFSDQLSQPSVTAIHKDSDGFLWIGTQLGLNRYDGSKITIFDSHDKAGHWVPASDISQIAESADGDIWIATYGGGLARYNGKEERFEAIPGNPDGTNTFLKSLTVSKTGIVWFGTRDAGMGAYNPKLQRYETWLNSLPLNHSMGQTFDILEDQSGRIWASGNNGLYLADPGKQSITTYPLPKSAKSNNPLLTVSAITQGTPGTIWAGTSDGKILQFDISTLSYKTLDPSSYSPDGWITDLAYRDDKLWVATDNGLAVTDQNGHLLSTFSRSNSSLSSNFAICLLAGQESVLVGTARGLNVFSYSVFEIYQNDNSRLFDDVTSFAESANHTIWVGTFNGVFHLEKHHQTHSSLKHIHDELILNDHRVTAIGVKNDELWLGYFKGGIQIVNLENGASRSLDLPNNSDLAITKIVHGKDGSSWIGTYNQGLYRINGKDITSYYNSPIATELIPEVAIMFIIETGNDTILVGSETTLYQINISTETVRALNLFFHNKKTKSVILSLAQNINGDIWIALKDLGLFIWHAQNTSSHEIHPEFAKGNPSLPGSTIYAIEFDDSGNAWASTTGGISKLSRQGELLKTYTVADGLQGNDFNDAASFKDSQGRLYFGGPNGYNRFDPNTNTRVTPPAPVVLTGINIAGLKPKLPVAAHKLEAIELSFRDYFITFEFSVLDYRDPKNNRYRYKLEGFDPTWIENGTRNSATYTNLPSGVYTFLVQGANSAGVWNRSGTSIRLVVHSAPWWSWQAFLFYFMLLSFLILAIQKYYDNSILRKRAAILTQEMRDVADKATDQLQEQLEYQDEFVRIVHTHSVNTLELISEFISRQADFVDDELIRETILSSTQRVTALAQLEECLFYQGDELLANLESFTNAIIDQLLRVAPELAQSVTTINEMPSRLIPVELATPLSIILFELLQNCFRHAFEGSSSGNYIHIRLEKAPTGNDREFKLSVKDNGVGIPSNISPGQFETSGLAIVSSIAERIGGSLSVSVDQGTSISIVFPSDSDLL